MRKAVWCLLLVFCCWGVSWWSWQYQHRSPTVYDIVLSGLIVPAVLLLMGWGVLRFFKTAAPRSEVSPTLSQVASEADVKERAGKDVQGEDFRKMRRMLGAAPMITRLGSDGPTLLQALRTQEVDFPLDEACLDDEGFPTITARMESLDIEATRASFMSLLAQKGGQKSDTLSEPWALLEGEIKPHEWRVLALMVEVIASMGDAVKTYNPYSVMGERKGNVETTMFPGLECLLLLPVGLQWSPSTCQQVDMYLSDAVAKWQWPSTRVLIRMVLTREDSQGVNVMSRIAKSMREQSESGAERITCVMMADTCFDEETLRHGQQVSGWIPGEAAAGLMLLPRASSAFPELEKSSLVMPHLAHQTDALMSRAAREQWMQDVIHEWLDLQATNVENLAACVSSGGATPAQLVEWMVLANACFDEMRAEDGLLTLQTVLGDVGQVADLLALCVAHEVVLGDEKPVLVVSHEAQGLGQGMLYPSEQQDNGLNAEIA